MKRNLLYLCLLAFWALFPSKAAGQDTWTYSYYTSNWTNIENGVVFKNGDVVRIPIFEKGYYAYGTVYAYLEAPYQRTYINKVTFTIHVNSSYSNGSYTYYYTTAGESTSSSTHSISDGQQVTLDQVNKYLHITNSTLGAYLDLIVSNWSNITKSTSENYNNYLSNTGTGTADSYGDYTSFLATSWSSGTNTSISDNWTGTTGDVYEISSSASQTVSNLPAGTYTVQGIVRGTEPVKLTLNDSEVASAETYGIGSDATFSSVNTCGRVDYNYDMKNNGWTKVEGTATLSSTGSLTIAFSSDAEFQLSDVVLLQDANTDGHYYTSADKVGQSNTYCDLSWQIKDEISTGLYIYYPKNNAFSFFDRGTNHNFVVYAHPRTVIGCDGVQVDSVDHRHPVNTAVETFYTDSYATSDTTGVYECQLLSLYDNVNALRVNGNPFGINRDFTASEVVYDRTVKAGQYTTGYFPFALTSTDLTTLYGEGSTAYTFSQVSDNNAVFSDVTEVAANTPFLVNPGAAKDSLIAGSNITNKAVVATPSTSTSTSASFNGTYTDLTLINGTSNYYIFNAQNAQGLFRPIKSTGAYVKPFRAYLEVPSNSAKPYYFFSVDDNTTTGIESVDATLNEENANQTVYSLDGRMVGTIANWQALPKGVYVVNGKKIVK